MKKEFKLIAIPLIVIAVIAGYFLTRKSQEPITTAVNQEIQTQISRSSAYVKGSQNAPVKIVEFLDPECGGCRAFYPVVMKVMEDYGDKLSLEVRYMLFHQNSHDAAMAMEAAGKQGKYFEFMHILFERQGEWANVKESVRYVFDNYATSLDLDLKEFQNGYEDFSFKSVIAQDLNDGKALGVNGTPTVFVNGKKLERLSYDLLKEAIDNELK